MKKKKNQRGIFFFIFPILVTEKILKTIQKHYEKILLKNKFLNKLCKK